MMKVEELEPREVPAAAPIAPAFCSWYGWAEGHEGDASYAGNWDGGVPRDGDTIYIPHNSSPLLDLTGLPLTSIGFQSSPDWGGTVVSSAIELVSPLLHDLTWQFSGGNLEISGQDGELAGVDFEAADVDDYVIVAAGATTRLDGGVGLNSDFSVEGTLIQSGGQQIIHSVAGNNSRGDVLWIRDGGQLIAEAWATGDLPTAVIVQGIPIIVQQGGSFIIRGRADGTIPVYVYSDSYIENNGTLTIESNGRLQITGATSTGNYLFPTAGLYSTGYVNISANAGPSFSSSEKLDVLNGWYQAGGFVSFKHNVPDALGPTNYPTVYIWGSVYMVDATVFTSGTGSVGTGGVSVAGSLTFYSSSTGSTTFRIRNSFDTGEGIDYFKAPTIAFDGGFGPSIIMDTIGPVTAGWRYFLIADPGTITGFAPVFLYDSAHWTSQTAWIQNSYWGDIGYVP